VDDRDAGVDLELGKGVRDADDDVIGMGCRAAKDGAEADNRIDRTAAGENAGDGWNFEAARDADDPNAFWICEFCFGKADECVGVTRIVPGGNNREAAPEPALRSVADFLQHDVTEANWRSAFNS